MASLDGQSRPRRTRVKLLTTRVQLTARELSILANAAPDPDLRRKLEKAYARAYRRRWDRERIVSAMRMWTARYGEPPTMREWDPQELKRTGSITRLRRFEEGEWPTESTVSDYFGTWNAAIREAGLPTRAPGGRVRRVPRECSVEDCGQTVMARGWCRKHYYRWYAHGDPLVVRKPGRQGALHSHCLACAVKLLQPTAEGLCGFCVEEAEMAA